MSYTDAAKVATYLGRTLTTAQQAHAASLAASAAAWWDRVTGRPFAASAVTDELHLLSDGTVRILDDWAQTPLTSRRIFLHRAPVGAVSSVKVRSGAIGGTDTTLTEGVDYELIDAQNGVLLLPAAYQGYYLKVSYTPASSVPDDVALANTMLTAHWLTPALDPDRHDLKQYGVGGELSVTAALEQTEIPAGVLAIAATYRGLVLA